MRELSGEVTLDGKPVTEVISAGRRIPVPSAIGKQTVAVVNPGKARVELGLGAGNLMVSDGETTWIQRRRSPNNRYQSGSETSRSIA